MIQPKDALRRLVVGDWVLLGGFGVLFLSIGTTWFKHVDPAVHGMIDPTTPYIHNSSSYYVSGLSTSLGGIVFLLAMLAVAAVANRVFELVAVPPVVNLLVPLGASGLGLLLILLQAAAGQQAAETRAAGLWVAVIAVVTMVVGAVLQPAWLHLGTAMTGTPAAASSHVAGGANVHYRPSAPPPDPAQQYVATQVQPFAAAAAATSATPETAAAVPEATCAACGTPFQTAESRFCRNCGAQRTTSG